MEELWKQVIAGVVLFVTGGTLLTLLDRWWRKRKDDREWVNDRYRDMMKSSDERTEQAVKDKITLEARLETRLEASSREIAALKEERVTLLIKSAELQMRVNELCKTNPPQQDISTHMQDSPAHPSTPPSSAS